MLAYVYIPVVQKELDVFRVSVWNNHRVRKQNGKELPTGVPEHIYTCPEQHGGEKCGIPITDQQLQEVAEFSHVHGQVRAICSKTVAKLHANCCHRAAYQMRSLGLLRLDKTDPQQHVNRIAASCR